MKIVCITYSTSNDVHAPDQWLDRLKIFIGSWEILARQHQITRIDLIGYSGNHMINGIHYLFLHHQGKKLYNPFRLHRQIAEMTPDIVLVAGLHFPLQVLMLRFQMPSRTRILVQHHAEKPFKGFKKMLQRLADAGIDAYFFVSKAMAENWVRLGNLANIKKVHQVMEVSSSFSNDKGPVKDKASIARRDMDFLFVGRLNANKDPMTVVRAFIRAQKEIPLARLYMIFQTNELQEEVRDLLGHGEDHGIELVGRLDHSEMANWYSKASFILSGSKYEGSGTAVCEAMSFGCIPILTRIDAFRAMTGDGLCGWLYEVGAEDALLGTILRALKSDISYERQKTLDQFRKELSFEAIAVKIQKVLGGL